ncbi:hypothetical protein VPH35_107138 [Triticum aestivum]
MGCAASSSRSHRNRSVSADDSNPIDPSAHDRRQRAHAAAHSPGGGGGKRREEELERKKEGRRMCALALRSPARSWPSDRGGTRHRLHPEAATCAEQPAVAASGPRLARPRVAVTSYHYTASLFLLPSPCHSPTSSPTPTPTPATDPARNREAQPPEIRGGPWREPSRAATMNARGYRSTRTALFDGIEEGGIRSSAYSSHEIDEHENERAMDGLQDRVSILKRISGDINEEVEAHNRMLDRMGNDMDSSRGFLSGTVDKFKTVFETKSSRRMGTLVASFVALFMLVYYLTR